MADSVNDRVRRYRETHKTYLQLRRHLELEIAKSLRAIERTNAMVGRADLELERVPRVPDYDLIASIRHWNAKRLGELKAGLADEREQLARLTAQRAPDEAAPAIDPFS